MERLGGRDVIVELTSGLYDGMLADPTLGGFLKRWMQTAPEEFYMQHLKDGTVHYLVGAWGEDGYHGQDLFSIHAKFHINPNMYDITMKCVKKQVKKMKLSKKLAAEVIAEFEDLRDPITDPDGKYDRWLREKYERAEKESLEEANGEVVSIMGFAMSKEKHDAYLAKELAQRERNARLKQIRKEREAEERAERERAAATRTGAKAGAKAAATKAGNGKAASKAAARKQPAGARQTKPSGKTTPASSQPSPRSELMHSPRSELMHSPRSETPASQPSPRPEASLPCEDDGVEVFMPWSKTTVLLARVGL